MLSRPCEPTIFPLGVFVIFDGVLGAACVCLTHAQPAAVVAFHSQSALGNAVMLVSCSQESKASLQPSSHDVCWTSVGSRAEINDKLMWPVLSQQELGLTLEGTGGLLAWGGFLGLKMAL